MVDMITVPFENGSGDDLFRFAFICVFVYFPFQHLVIEYVLISGINDGDTIAHELGALLAHRKHFVLLNVIPYNPTDVPFDYKYEYLHYFPNDLTDIQNNHEPPLIDSKMICDQK